MIGGTVIDTLDCKTRVWVNVRDDYHERDEPTAIYLERNSESLQIAAGDCIWWQGRKAYWTPKAWRGRSEEEKQGYYGIRHDIEIPRVGYSGVNHPAQAMFESSMEALS